jgi:tetratricopeptide (TPR) repeat protein
MKQQPIWPYIVSIGLGFVVVSCHNPGEPSRQIDTLPKDSVKEDVSSNPLNKVSRQIIENPNDPKLYVKRAKLLLQNNDFEKAKQDVLKALETDSSFSDAYELLADIAIATKEGKEVKKYLEKAIEKNPENISAHLKLAQLYLAFNNFEDALESVNNALKSDMYNADAYYLKSTIFLIAGDTANAISNLQTAIEQNPEFYKAYVDLGYIYAQKKSPLALEYYNNAIQINPTNPTAIYNKSLFLQEMGNYEKALEGYDLILKINPVEFRAYYNKGYIYLTVYKNYEKAITAFKNVVKINSSYPDALYNLGLAYELSGNKDSALFYYKEALKRDATHPLAATGISRLR